MSEIVLQAMIVLMVVAAFRFFQTLAVSALAVVCGALVLAFLLKPVFYPLAMVMACVGAGVGWRFRRAWLSVVGLVPLVAVGLYMGWNWQRTGYFHFSSIAEINLLHYNGAGVVRQVSGPVAEEKWVAEVLHEANTASEFTTRQRVIQARVWKVLEAHPWIYSQQHLLGMVTFFLDPGRFDISQFLRLPPLREGGMLSQLRAGNGLAAVRALPFGLLVLLGVILASNVARLVLAVRGFMLLKKCGAVLRYGRWIAAGLLLYVALLTGPLGAARFLVPVWPLLLGLALVGLQGSELAKFKSLGGVSHEPNVANG